MRYLKFGDFLKDNNIFEEIKKVENFPFLTYPEDLDLQLKIKFSERYFINGFNDLSIEQIVRLIISIYKNKWEDLIVLNAELSLLKSGANIETLTENSIKTISGDNSTTNKVGAYNSDELITDNSNTNLNNENEDFQNTTQKENNKLDYQKVYNSLNYTDKTNTINIVLKDVSNYLTLDIY